MNKVEMPRNGLIAFLIEKSKVNVTSEFPRLLNSIIFMSKSVCQFNCYSVLF